MDDEDKLLELDTLVRDAVTPPDEAIDRVVLKALSDNRKPPRRRAWLSMAIAAAVVVLLGIAVWRWRSIDQRRAESPSLAISGEGSMLVVESQDGRRWIVGPPPRRRIGSNIVLVVPE